METQVDMFDFNTLVETNDVEMKKAAGKDGKGAIPDSVWETYSAMANTVGGVIILGAEQIDEREFRPYNLCNADVLPTLESYIRDFVFLWYSMSETKPQKEHQNAESTIYSRREGEGRDAPSSGWHRHFHDLQRTVHSSQPFLHLAEAAFCRRGVSF